MNPGINDVQEERKLVKEADSRHPWFEMPIAGGSSDDDPARPPFECGGEATFVYHGQFVYARFSDPGDEQEAEQVPGSRRLTVDEVQKLDAEMSFPYLAWASRESGDPLPERNYYGLGDAVSWFLGKLGFSECPGCRSRKAWLNHIPLWPRRHQGSE